MSNDDNPRMAVSVIENGAFLYIKRPANPELLRYLWKHVARESMRVMRERERLIAASYITPPCGTEFREMENPNNLFNMDKGKRKRNDSYNEKYVENEHNFDNSMMSQGNVKRKMCTHWTKELHEKFEEVCYQLGDGSIYPKEIAEKMNVAGLEKKHVASHLQKIRQARGKEPESSDGKRSSHKERRFGRMPQIMLEKLKERVHDHSSNSEMEGRVTERRMTNQSSDGEGSSHKTSRFGSMPEIMKDKSKGWVDDHESISEMANETGMANQPTFDNLQHEALYANLENIAQDIHFSSSHLSFGDIEY
ncbi:two-component response regulator ARR14-like [Salvia splendens]|nr:two-component response regulator ARR14-like [Salvia splendens]